MGSEHCLQYAGSSTVPGYDSTCLRAVLHSLSISDHKSAYYYLKLFQYVIVSEGTNKKHSKAGNVETISVRISNREILGMPTRLQLGCSVKHPSVPHHDNTIATDTAVLIVFGREYFTKHA